MKHVGLLAAVLCLCLSCAGRPELREHETRRQREPQHVKLLARDVHAGKYAAWEIRLWRIIDSGKGWETSEVYLTSVATDALKLSGHYKRVPDSGMEYVAIDELNIFFAVKPGDEVGSVVREEEYMSANAEPIKLRVGGVSREVEHMQFPLLPSRSNQ